jgi:hypothetical protein
MAKVNAIRGRASTTALWSFVRSLVEHIAALSLELFLATAPTSATHCSWERPLVLLLQRQHLARTSSSSSSFLGEKRLESEAGFGTSICSIYYALIIWSLLQSLKLIASNCNMTTKNRLQLTIIEFKHIFVMKC